MKKLIRVGLVLIALSLVWVHGIAAEGVFINYPKTGDALQGLVIISGSTDLAGFQSAELSFNYVSGTSQNWFLIQQSQAAVKDGALAVWDTSTIADGMYRLRIQVILQDNKTVETIVEGLRVRNYSPIETNTPDLAKPSRQTPSITPIRITVTPRNTPTNFPANPLVVQPAQLTFSLVEGGTAAMIGLILVSSYMWVKRRR